MSEEALNGIAKNFLVDRNEGNRARGAIKLYYHGAIDVVIPVGTRFSDATGEKIYQTTTAYSITRGSMLLNRDQYPLYNTDSISIESVNKGVEFNVGPLEVSKSVTFAGTPYKIENTNALVGGVVKETNSEFYERLLTTILGPNISSIAGITRTIKQEFPNVVDVKVIGSPDPLMTRDLSILTTLVENFKEEDFYLVYPEQHNFALSKGHEAFWGEFIDLDENAAIKLPAPSAFTTEFDITMYEGIMLKADLRTAEAEVQSIAQEFFNEAAIISGAVMDTMNTVSGSWEIHDSRNSDGMLFYADEIRVADGVLKLGKHIDLTQSDLAVEIPYSTLEYLQSLLVTSIEYIDGSDVETDS
ncbi:MAG: baseplate J/gp47 family protein [Rhodobacteraceae bacterium]|nr:baseplate J/gp47 family protein [Paracoccaceae bacterium]